MVFSDRVAAAWRAAGSVFDSVLKRIVRVRLKLHTGYVSLFTVCASTNEPKNEGERERSSTGLCKQQLGGHRIK